ncbi:MAG: DUF3987 domain-containing protein [Thermomonas sp.]|uniref:YfjI family protein n=1 Tax=Thermomonas sp. TaxID=1971895 RepID=UPI001D38CE6F|nr:YfjI family protein [Thermomonas sp.]MBZ0088552.1 DUF3987 domain-containing protein [Thermomonas sp.]
MNGHDVARVASKTAPVTACDPTTFPDIAKLLATAKRGHKDGPAWLPARIQPGPRNGERVEAVTYLVLDVEADAENVKDAEGKPVTDEHGDNVKRVIGPEPPDVKSMSAELGLWGWQALLHTSYSHSEQHPRYRLVFDLDRELAPAELRPLGLHVAGLLGLSDCIDKGALEPARLFYLPRCPTAERIEAFQSFTASGKPLPVDRLLRAAQREQEAMRKSANRKHSPRTGNVIDGFNRAHDVRAILEAHGYQPKGRNRWLFAGSTTGMPGVRLLPDGNPERVYSSHSGDPLNDGHAHDAFDVFRILDHGGDMARAVKAAAAELGEDHEGARAAPESQTRTAPEPLRRPVPPPQPYPLAELGDVLAPAAQTLRRVIQAPDAVCGASVLAAASLAVQGLANIERERGAVYPLSLWVLTVGESSERKSAVDTEAMRAARDYERELCIRYSDQEAEHDAKLKEWEARRRAAEGKANKADGKGLAEALLAIGPAPPAPLLPRVTVADFTAEGLSKLLAAGWPSVGAFTDEAALVFGGHGMTKETVMRTAATLCKLWDSGTLDRVRALDGATKLYGRRLALHLLAQPVIAERALSDAVLTGQGFLPRCLLAWPESTVGTRPYREEALWDDHALQRLAVRLGDLHRTPLPLAPGQRQELVPPVLSLSPEAKRAWIKLHDAIESKMAPGGQFATVKPWAGKTPEQVLRIAGVLTLVDDASAQSVDAATLERAAELALWHLNEAVRLAGTAELAPEVRNAEALLNWCHATGRTLLYSTVAMNRGPACIRDQKSFRQAVAELERAGWAWQIEGGAEVDGKHRRHVWRIEGGE